MRYGIIIETKDEMGPDEEMGDTGIAEKGHVTMIATDRDPANEYLEQHQGREVTDQTPYISERRWRLEEKVRVWMGWRSCRRVRE